MVTVIDEESLRQKIEKEQRHIYCSDPSLYYLLQEKYSKNGWHVPCGQQWVLKEYINKKVLDKYYKPGGRRDQIKKERNKKEPLGGNTYVRQKKFSESWEEYQKYIHNLKEKILSGVGMSHSDREYMNSYHKYRERSGGIFMPED